MQLRSKILRSKILRLAALAAACWVCGLSPAYALPSFARQTGQKCVACHVGGDWPQLTPWGRFFKLSGYTAGKSLIDHEGDWPMPVGLFGQAGVTWASQPNDSQGGTVVDHNGQPQFYQATAEVATKITNFAGLFYEYQLGNTSPGWKGATGPADIRAVHFLNVGGHEILLGVDSNNAPTVQDVYNSSPDWSFPFYGSPQAPGAPASPILTNLGAQVGSIGAYALIDRKFYVEASVYRPATGIFRFMSAGTGFQAGDKNYLQGFNPYWRAYWNSDHGPHSFMLGTFGMQARVYPDSSNPVGATNLFTDYGVDSQYQYLGMLHKITLRGSYIYERRGWDASFPLGDVGNAKANLKTINVSGTYSHNNAWSLHGGYLQTNGSSDSSLFAINTPDGTQVTASPKTVGYVVQVNRPVTQNIQLMAQYRGYLWFNGVRRNIDGIGRNASDNNTLWLSVFFAF